MKKAQATGFTRLAKAWGYSCKGLSYAWKNEAAFRTEIVLCCFFIPAAILLGNNAMERSLLLAVTLLVVVVEIINSAIEAVVDRIGPEHHALAGSAKDLGSAAVMISLIITGVTWLLFIVEWFFK